MKVCMHFKYLYLPVIEICKTINNTLLNVFLTMLQCSTVRMFLLYSYCVLYICVCSSFVKMCLITDNCARMHEVIKLPRLVKIGVVKNSIASRSFRSRFVILIALVGPQLDSLRRPNNLLARFSDVSSVNGTTQEVNHEEFRLEVRFCAFLGVMRFVYVEI